MVASSVKVAAPPSTPKPSKSRGARGGRSSASRRSASAESSISTVDNGLGLDLDELNEDIASSSIALGEGHTVGLLRLDNDLATGVKVIKPPPSAGSPSRVENEQLLSDLASELRKSMQSISAGIRREGEEDEGAERPSRSRRSNRPGTSSVSSRVGSSGNSVASQQTERAGTAERSVSPSAPLPQQLSVSSSNIPATPRSQRSALGNRGSSKGRRKAITKTDEKFRRLTQLLPQFKIDKEMRKTIIQSLKEINCWSDDEEDDDDTMGEGRDKFGGSDKEKDNHTLSDYSISYSVSSRASDAKAQEKSREKNNKKKIHDLSSGATGNESTEGESDAERRTGRRRNSSILSPREPSIDKLSTPQSVRARVSLHRPKQIPESAQLLTKGEQRRRDREAVREKIVQQAIHVLVELRKEQDETQMMNVVSLLKEQSSSHYVAVKRVTFGLVDRAIKRAKHIANVQMGKLIEKEQRYQLRAGQMARRLLRVFRRYRLRKLCRAVLAAGSAIRKERMMEEQRELYAFRKRVAMRRIQEDAQFRQWRFAQKEQPTFPVPPQKPHERPLVVMNNEGDLVAVTSVDESLLAQDDEHTRPDLAPFSTQINDMIYQALRPVPESTEELVRTNDGYQFNSRQTILHCTTFEPQSDSNVTFHPPTAEDLLSLESRKQAAKVNNSDLYLTDSQGSSPRSRQRPNICIQTSFIIPNNNNNNNNPPTNGRSTKSMLFPDNVPTSQSSLVPMSAIARKTFNFQDVNTPQQRVSFFANTPIASARLTAGEGPPSSSRKSFHTPSSVKSNEWRGTAELASGDSTQPQPYKTISHTSKYEVEIPMWEQMARLDHVPKVQDLREEKKNKSAAYKALEKLCGLTEEDIKKQKRTESTTRPSNHLPLYNTNLLSLFK